MTSELLPCPFCGGKAKIDEYPSSGTAYGVGCTSCMATSGLHYAGGRRLAIQSWNTRVIDATLSAKDKEIEALSNIINKKYLREFDLLEKIAPILGLKPFKCPYNNDQMIWAESLEQAKNVGLGESIFKFVEQALEQKAKSRQISDDMVERAAKAIVGFRVCGPKEHREQQVQKCWRSYEGEAKAALTAALKGE